MDLYKAFVTSVIFGGVEAYRKVLEKGVLPEFLEGAGRTAWEFIVEYYGQYKSLPSPEVIEGRTSVRLEGPPKEPAEFYAQEVLNIRLHTQLGKRLEVVAGSLAARKPQEAFDHYTDGLIALRKEGIAVSKTISLPTLGPKMLEFYDKIKSGHRGIETPWPTVNESTLGFWPEDFILYVARLGVGKCVAADTIITDPETGVPCTIEEVYESESFSSITTWSKEKGVHVAPISAKVDTGEKDCICFVTSSTGRSITVTPEHPLLTPAGWVEAKDVNPGTMIALPMKTPLPKKPIRISSVLLDQFAITYALGGCVSELTRDRFDPDISKFATTVFGEECEAVIAGLRNQSPKCLPDAVWMLGEGDLSRFLGVLWLYGGEVSPSNLQAVFHLEADAKGVQSLLVRLGVQSKLFHTGAAWAVNVLYSHYRVFFENVGLFPAQKSTLRFILEKDVWSSGSRPSQPEKPGRFRRFLAGLFKPKELVKKGDKHAWVWSTGLFWDVVESVQDVGPTKIYDLTVPSTSCFVANDIVVHNTWTLVQIMLHAWFVQGKRVLFVTTEMSQEKILQRAYSILFKLPYDNLRRGRLDSVSEQKLRDGVESLVTKEGLYIVGGKFDFSIGALEAAIEESEPDVCVLDGAYLIKTSGDGRTERAANSFDELKRCAKRNKIPLVASTQFNREVKQNSGDSVSVEKIALSDAAGWNADLVFGLLQTNELKSTGLMIQKPLKFREGVGDDIVCKWDFVNMDFSEVPKDLDVSGPSDFTSQKKIQAGPLSLLDRDDDGNDAVPF